MCLHIFIFSHCLPFLSIKLADFIVPEANLMPLLTFERVHFAKFHYIIVFSVKYWTGHQYFIHKKELYCALASIKKINTRLAFVYYPNGNEMDQMVRNDIACYCIPIVRIAFRYAHISF